MSGENLKGVDQTSRNERMLQPFTLGRTVTSNTTWGKSCSMLLVLLMLLTSSFHFV